MAYAKITKIIGNVLNNFFSSIYRRYVILNSKTTCNSSNFIYMYDFTKVMVKYERS